MTLVECEIAPTLAQRKLRNGEKVREIDKGFLVTKPEDVCFCSFNLKTCHTTASEQSILEIDKHRLDTFQFEALKKCMDKMQTSKTHLVVKGT